MVYEFYLKKLHKRAKTEIQTLEPVEDNSKGKPIAEGKNDYENTIWFKTGVKLATGEAFDLYHKYKNDKGHFARITKELGFKESDRTYFSTTIGGNSKSDKNTFANKDKVQKIYNHLKENSLTACSEFQSKYDSFKFE